MQFWLKCSLVIAMTSTVVGCASPEDKVINEDHKYVNTPSRHAAIKVPAGSKSVVGEDTYVLPKQAGSGNIGEQLDIRSPMQLLALASGSRLDDTNKTSKIWFDRTAVIDDLPQFTFEALTRFLNSKEVVGSVSDEAAKTMQTGWVKDVKEGSIWPWGDQARSVGYQFKTWQKSSAKGYSTSVEVKLIGYQRNEKDVPLSSLKVEDVERAEVQFLNEYIYYFQLLQEDMMKKAQIARASDFTLAVGVNEQGQQVFRSAKSVETVWVEFRTLLEKMGFVIDDVDRTTKKLYVTYALPEQGFWSSLWDDELQSLDLAPAKYIVRVTQMQRASVITFYNKDEQPLAESYYSSMEKTLVEVAKKMTLDL